MIGDWDRLDLVGQCADGGLERLLVGIAGKRIKESPLYDQGKSCRPADMDEPAFDRRDMSDDLGAGLRRFLLKKE